MLLESNLDFFHISKSSNLWMVAIAYDLLKINYKPQIINYQLFDEISLQSHKFCFSKLGIVPGGDQPVIRI